MTKMGTMMAIDDDGVTIMGDDNVTCIRKMTIEVDERECVIAKRECVMWVTEERKFFRIYHVYVTQTRPMKVIVKLHLLMWLPRLTLSCHETVSHKTYCGTLPLVPIYT